MPYRFSRLSRTALRSIRYVFQVLILTSMLAGLCLPAQRSAAARPDEVVWNYEITGPEGSGAFGYAVYELPNQNIVVLDPAFSADGKSYLGAVYLYDGQTRVLISTMTGEHPNDTLGSDRVLVLADGNFVVVSSSWDNGLIQDAGAATFCSGTTGCPAQVSAENSLVGSTAYDRIGYGRNGSLPEGGYFIGSPFWDNGSVADAGAYTFCTLQSGCVGPLSDQNSLVGSHVSDYVGGAEGYVSPISPNLILIDQQATWDSDTTKDAGALTFCESYSNCHGVISAANSLVGVRTGYQSYGRSMVTRLATGNYLVEIPSYNAVKFCTGVADCVGDISSGPGSTAGYGKLTILPNGNYVLAETNWSGGGVQNAGAIRWCSGQLGCTGPITAESSLIGGTLDDHVGYRLVVLSNSSYLVVSPDWDSPTAVQAGAVTWCPGDSGCTGIVSSANSLVGSSANDQVGYSDYFTRIETIDGAYLVLSRQADRESLVDVGAVTWCSADSGCQGEITVANSLMGSAAGDASGMVAYSRSGQSHYLVVFSSWDAPGVADAGAVTWCPVNAGCSGIMSAANSLVGSHANDRVGSGGAVVLTGGSLVLSPSWSGSGSQVGAATLCSTPAGCPGVVDTGNSLVGQTAGDSVGTGATPDGLAVVISSSLWKNATGDIAGALSYCKVGLPCTGIVGTGNSLVGTKAGDLSENAQIVFSAAGDYTVNAPSWDNGSNVNVGASAWCDGDTGCQGTITPQNSRVGVKSSDNVSRGGNNPTPGSGSFQQGGTTFLPSGEYVVYSQYFSANGLANTGAISVCEPGNCTGPVSAQNSLLGSQHNEQLGQYQYFPLDDGSFVVLGYNLTQLLWCHNSFDCRGTLASHPRAVVATNNYTGQRINFTHKVESNRIVVGLPMDNRVVILLPEPPVVMFGLSSSASTALPGDMITFTAAVETASGPAAGSIAFTADTNPAVDVEVVNGTATFSTSFATVGMHRVRAVFSGSGSLTGETAQDEILVSITPPQVSLTLTPSNNPSVVGQQVTYTATASSISGVPTGKVTFMVNGGSAVVVDLVNGSATHSITFAEPDTYFVRAEYVGTGAFSGSSKVAQVTQTVNNLTVTVNLASSANPAAAGSEVTYTAVASSNNGTPTGSISFSVNMGAGVTVPLVNDVASFTTTFASEGSYFIQANFSGTGAFAGRWATDSLTQMISPTPVTLQVSSSQNPAPVGQPVTLTARASSDQGTPVGTMSFVIDGGTPVQVALDGGAASTTHTFNQAGTHLIQVSFTGMGAFAGKTASTSYQQGISLPEAVISLSSSKNPSPPGEQVTFTATASSTSGTPTGTVSFRIDDFPAVPVALTNGAATFSYPFQETGSYAIHATFTGSGSFTGVSAEADLTQAVATVAPPMVSLQVTAPSGRVLAGQMVTFGVTATCSKGTPTGSITVSIDGGIPMSVELVNGGVQVSLRFAEPGQHTVQVSFSGSGEYAGVSAAAQDVEQAVLSALFLPALIRQ